MLRKESSAKAFDRTAYQTTGILRDARSSAAVQVKVCGVGQAEIHPPGLNRVDADSGVASHASQSPLMLYTAEGQTFAGEEDQVLFPLHEAQVLDGCVDMLDVLLGGLARGYVLVKRKVTYSQVVS